jgi:hypothetical protein
MVRGALAARSCVHRSLQHGRFTSDVSARPAQSSFVQACCSAIRIFGKRVKEVQRIAPTSRSPIGAKQ